jgi:branched-chain amino acid aminotransferase
MVEHPFVWLNGALLPAAEARIDPADRGFTLADGLFETLRATQGAPRHVGLHLARLRHGAAQLGIPVAFTEATLLAACTELLAANALNEAVLRLTLTRGPGLRGLAPPPAVTPTLLITAAGFPPVPDTVTAIICRTTRRNEFSPLAAIKSLNYLDNIIARREAATRHAEDAILLNTQQNIAEATAANLFLLSNGTWRTPLIRDGALPGILRARLLAAGLVQEARITEADLFSADSICLGNTLSVRSVSSVDGVEININKVAANKLREVQQD